jgi:hypothetical protein
MPTTLQTALEILDSDFEPFARAVENGQFALWVGSGISPNAPSLGILIDSALEFLRAKASDTSTSAEFRPALEEALSIAEVPTSYLDDNLHVPVSLWPKHDGKSVSDRLWNSYSRFLGISVAGKDEDFILWDAVDIRKAFSNPSPPRVEHLCIAILVLEDAVKAIASANWDGFIETSIEQLGFPLAGILQVVVDPNHLRDVAGKAQLLKFHGCVVHATQAEGLYRKFLTGSEAQILQWRTAAKFGPMVAQVQAVATNYRALLLGLSLQDNNLKEVFAAAKSGNPWPWPCAPNAQGQVICTESGLNPNHTAMLKVVYSGVYNEHVSEIRTSAELPCWPDKVLPALVLRIVFRKLAQLMSMTLASLPCEVDRPEFEKRLINLRNAVASLPGADLTAFVIDLVEGWGRIVGIFRDGQLPSSPQRYQVISAGAPSNATLDANAIAAGFGSLVTILSVLHALHVEDGWTISRASGPLGSGAFVAKGDHASATERPVFVVRSAAETLRLQRDGAFSVGNEIVIHSDDAWATAMVAAGAPASPRARKRAPGRVGGSQTHHVLFGALLNTKTSFADLKKSLAKAAVL